MQVEQSVSFPLRDGLKVRVRGRLTIYKEQGRFQLYIEEMLLSGEGELLAQFEELKARLAREGLFDAARKRPLPRFPRVVGTVIDRAISGNRDNGGGGIAYFLIVMVLQVVLGILASVIVMAFSRWREFRADAGSARLSSKQKMISALERLGQGRGGTGRVLR